MVCPPQVGATPERGRHGGLWAELRDDAGELAFVRVLPEPLLGSVEVHDPDGAIHREFGPREVVFEVLVPDLPDAATLVLVGEPTRRVPGPEDAGGVAELARFDLRA